MSVVALALAALAVVVALRALSVANDARRGGELGRRSAKDRVDKLERYVKLMGDGVPVTSDMIDDERLYPEIDAEAARELVEDAQDDVVVLDVRTPEEFDSGHIPGALSIPVAEIERRADEVPREARVLVFCAVGGRSAAACHALSERGFTNVVNVDGGMTAWRGAVTRDPRG